MEPLNIWSDFPEGWKSFLGDELKKEYLLNLTQRLEHEYSNNVVFPSKENLFSAFKLCSPTILKAVIIGQDPYHGNGQANGLCFSVSQGQTLPPSLKNILKELTADTGIIKRSGDLSSWAEQGVLMLNTVLSVREAEANSHKSLGWKKFTKAVIQKINSEQSGILFFLWGGQAQTFSKIIDSDKHHLLLSGHPSPLSANRGYWFGNKHFSAANRYLKAQGVEPIRW